MGKIMVDIKLGDSENICGYEVLGHSECDRVCASVSAITQTALMGIEEVCVGYKHLIETEMNESTGLLRVFISENIPWHYIPNIEAILHAMEVGLVSICLDNPADLGISWSDCRGEDGHVWKRVRKA